MIIWLIPLIFAIIWFRLGFWNRQPIRHYMTLYKKGIIREHPINNKFVIPKVEFYNLINLSKELENEIYDFQPDIIFHLAKQIGSETLMESTMMDVEYYIDKLNESQPTETTQNLF